MLSMAVSADTRPERTVILLTAGGKPEISGSRWACHNIMEAANERDYTKMNVVEH